MWVPQLVAWLQTRVRPWNLERCEREIFSREGIVVSWQQRPRAPLTPEPVSSSLAPAKLAGSPEPPSRSQTSSTTPKSDLDYARNTLWQSAYKQLAGEEPDLVKAYEALIKNDAALNADAALLEPENMTMVVTKTKERMENKQWTYTWFGKPQKVQRPHLFHISVLFKRSMRGAGSQMAGT